MTETSPLGTQGSLLPKHLSLPADEQCTQRARQGRPVFGVEMRVVDANGKEQPRDGKSAGELMVRGPWIAREYFKGKRAVLRDGWFPTGDIAAIDADGYIQITDRLKDVIKSGGEWISSIDLENATAGHPAVVTAAVIGVRHPKWGERPVMFVVKKPGQCVDGEEIVAYLADKVAK
jgi:acyl-CoA synthetase (AMP-forming)/AMP-acid ligase II